jgi:hypothetical protein
MRRVLLASAVLVGILAPTRAAVAQAPVPTTSAKPQASAPSTRRERQLVCRGAAIPAGWALVDDTRDPSMCAGDNPSVARFFNIWVIERIDRVPVGGSVEVCSGAPTPDGWLLVDVYRSKEVCGHPDDPFVVNVKRIRRSR